MNHAWDDFYEGSFTTFKGGEIPSDGQYYVHDCTFSGGADRAISFVTSNADNKLLTESSSFTDYFRIPKHGAAIYFNSAGQFCMTHVCGRNCSTTTSSYGQFSYSRVTSESTKQNFMSYSTVFSCGEEKKRI